MEPLKKMFEAYKLYLFTFCTLSILTLISVGLKQLRLASPLIIGLIWLIAVFQAGIVLTYNMHLKFHDKILAVFVGVVFTLMLLIMIVTVMDFV